MSNHHHHDYDDDDGDDDGDDNGDEDDDDINCDLRPVTWPCFAKWSNVECYEIHDEANIYNMAVHG